MVKGSSPAAGMGMEKMAESLGSGMHASSNSTVVEHLPLHPKVKVSSPAAGMGMEKMAKMFRFGYVGW